MAKKESSSTRLKPPSTSRDLGFSDSWSDVSDVELDNVDEFVEDRLAKSLDFSTCNSTTIQHVNHTEFPYSQQNGPCSEPPLAVRSRTSDFRDNDVRHSFTESLPANHRALQPDSGFSQNEASGKNSKNKSGDDFTDALKSKFMTAWNNMRHGWTVRTKTLFRYTTPVWLLGKCYLCTPEEIRLHQESQDTKGKALLTAMEKFKQDFFSRFWFTYRRDFPPLEGTDLTSDLGWGCMIRTGQMLLAQALVMHFLGRDWKWHNQQRAQDMIRHQQIIRYFGDGPFDECPFSLHRLVKLGAQSGRKPGDWYGPSSMAYVLKDAVSAAGQLNPLLGRLCLYVAQDCTVYKQDVIDMCTKPGPASSTSHQGASSADRHHQADASSTQNNHQLGVGSTSSGHQVGINSTDSDCQVRASSSGAGHQVEYWRAVVILIPMRLGGESLNADYIACVQSLLAHDMCLGIMGGKPKHSLFFIGFQEDKLVYLDPHFCQPFVDVRQKDFSFASFHCSSPRKVDCERMDPSCTVGFYCSTRAEFNKVTTDIQKMVAPPLQKALYPMFIFEEGRSSEMSLTPKKRVVNSAANHRLERGPRTLSQDSDDFVLL